MSGESKLPSEVSFTHLDEQLFDGADATKRDLVEYLDAVHACMLPCLTDRPLSVIRIRPGQPAFMQKNLPKYTPDWVPRVPIWAEASRREVSYALCNDRPRCSGSRINVLWSTTSPSSGLIAGTSRTIWYSILIRPKEQPSR